MERYLTTTYRLHELHMCVQGGYVTTTYPKFKNDAFNVQMNEVICFITS